VKLTLARHSIYIYGCTYFGIHVSTGSPSPYQFLQGQADPPTTPSHAPPAQKEKEKEKIKTSGKC